MEHSAVVVLAGGSSRRFGTDKLDAPVDRRSVLQATIDQFDGCAQIVVVGPRRPLRGNVRFVTEHPPGGGPLAAIAAGVAAVDQPLVWVMAGDQPLIGRALPELRRALEADRPVGGPVEVALLVDRRLRRRYLAALWRRQALLGRLSATAPHHGEPARLLYDSVAVAEVVDGDDWSADCDTPEQLAEIRRRLANDDEATRHPH